MSEFKDNMNDFKVGDKVKFISKEKELGTVRECANIKNMTIGNIYEVVRSYGDIIWIVDDDNYKTWYFISRFKLYVSSEGIPFICNKRKVRKLIV